MSHRLSIIFIILSLVCVNSLLASATDTLCQLPLPSSPNAHIQGVRRDSYCAFLSISYATAQRFQPPRGIPNVSSQDATSFSPMCAQDCLLPDGFCGEAISDECLTLNVYVPHEQMRLLREQRLKGEAGHVREAHREFGSQLPVMAFLPGGGFEMGTSNCDAFEAHAFTSRNTILVTINYRVGAFGFMVNKDLGIEGNMGVWDQIEAMKWVQRNIGIFGGDSKSVTLAGESAGAQSVAIHLVSDVSAGLFQQAILESPVFSIWMRSTDSANRLGKTLAKMLQCSTLECMQKVPLPKLLEAQKKAAKKISLHTVAHVSTLFLGWTPVVDGNLLTGQPLKLIQEGKVDPEIPIIIGTNAEEGLMFIRLAFDDPFGSWMYRGVVAALFKSDVFKVLKEYPASSSTSKDYRNLSSVIATDYIFGAPTHAAARALAMNGNTVFWYEFDQQLSFGWGPRYAFCNGHSCHGAELGFVFAPPLAQKNFSPKERILSNLMADFWANFVKTSNPNSLSTPEWGNFDPRGKQSNCMRFEGDSSKTQINWRTEMTSFWDRIGYTKLM
mmetsp:Transcript_4436/g.16735  ORF Transcript_4436/g.16735 Transcript_4436/m.16735 type:complete len:555 (+) Transcript_4436:1-1665(+)